MSAGFGGAQPPTSLYQEVLCMPASLSPSGEDYLEAVHDLSEEGAPVRVTDVALKLGVSKASVFKAMVTLKDNGLVAQEHYGALTLTEHGVTRAHQVVGRHHSIKRFLMEVLGVPEELAEKDACRMEHGMSDLTIERLMAFMRDR